MEKFESAPHYKFIWDAKQIENYCDLIGTVDGQFMLMLQTRPKYAPVGEKKGKEVCIKQYLCNYESKNVLKKIEAFEVRKGCYLDNDGNPIDRDLFVVYLSDNPRDTKAAFQQFMEGFARVVNNPQQLSAFVDNTYTNLRSYLHSKAQKKFLVLDVDDKNLEASLRILLVTNNIKCITVETRSGFHVLLYNHILSPAQRKIVNDWCQEYEVSAEFIRATPVPGTIQGGFPVKLRDDMTFLPERE